MKKTLLLLLIALLAAPLWGQTYGEATTEQLRQLANNGDAMAQSVLGDRYYDGDRAPQDYKQAVYWYTKAANQGDAAAQYNLGVCYYNGEGVAQDYKQAVYWYTKAANQGEAVAQYKLGLCYFGGNGTARDWQQAVSWFTKAANQGYANAQYCLGVCFASGRGVGNDSQQALSWFKKAKQNGFTCNDTTHYFFIPEDLKFEVGVTEGARAKGIFVSGDLNHWYKKGLIYCWLDDEIRAGEKVEAIRKAANQGNAKSQFELGAMYHRSNLVLVSDMKQAVHWYTKAANQGYARAQDTLGDCYYKGDGVEKNLKQATNWYTKAARQGNASAQYKLASLSGLEGLDDKQRLYWCTQAANKGHAKARGSLPYHFFRAKDYTQAITWANKAKEDHYGRSFDDFIKACEKIIHATRTKDAKEQYEIGLGFRDGKIGKYDLRKKDYKEAVHWFNLSANQGNADAIFRLAECYELGNGVEKNVEKAIALYQKVANQGRVDAMYRLAQCYEKEGYMDNALLLYATISANPDAHPYYKMEAEKFGQRMRERYSSNPSTNTTGSTAAKPQRSDSPAAKPTTTAASTSAAKPQKTAEPKQEKADTPRTLPAEPRVAADQYELATRYHRGTARISKDMKQAIRWYTRAANQGSVEAMLELGRLYYHGTDVAKDADEAQYWLQKIELRQQSLQATKPALVKEALELLGRIKQGK